MSSESPRTRILLSHKLYKMIRSFIPVLLFFIAFQLSAQTPGNIHYDGHLGSSDGPRMCNEAGTITFGTFIGQSNDTDPDIIFLCLGDTLPIIHNQDFDLTGDPQPSTPAGIGYAFYDCEPTISGPDLNTVLTDPCVNQTSPIVIGGMDVNQTNGIWIATENINGNLTLVNNGILQEAFNGGVAAPVQFWFAPITIDDFATQGFENDGLGGPVGPCVDVNEEEAFSVIYLNEITVSNINTNTNATGCEGSFVVEGGLPEFDTNTEYDITITLSTDPNVVIMRNGSHGDEIDFFIPEPGIYDIVIEDGKSCGASFQMDMSGCQAVTFSFPMVNAMPGENVCLDLTVENFNNIVTAQFTITYDPNILQFTNVGGFNPNVPDLGGSSFNPGSPGILTFAWANFAGDGVNINDGETFYHICFDVIGSLGESSPLGFSNTPTPIEIGDPSIPEPLMLGYILNDGVVNVSDNVLAVTLTQDSVTCAGDSDGAFTLTVGGGTAPYQFTWNSLPPMGPDNGPVVIPTSGGSASITNVMEGLYEVRISDSSNPANTSIDTVEVLGAPELGVFLDDLVSPSCFGGMDGSVAAIITLDGVPQAGAVPGISFSWSNTTDNVPTLTELTSGFYGVTVMDSNGCMAQASTTLSQPPELLVTVANTTIQDATCSGSMDGTITITPTGGSTADGNYNYSWSNGLNASTGPNAQVSNLDPGQYCVTVTDDNDCEFTNCFNVTAAKVLSTNVVVTDISCNGICDGEIFVTGSASGIAAVLPYNFTWSSFGNPPVNTDMTSNLTGLCAGTYFLTLSDSDPAGCQILDTIVVAEPELLEVSLLDQVNESCVVGNDGSITIGVTGGTFPFSYQWDDPAMQTDSIITGLSQNTYNVVVTDANNCTDNLSVDILAPTPPSINPIADASVSCPEDTDGSLSVTATPGGAAIVSYDWSNGDQGADITNLGPGTYIVTVTAEDGCSSIDSAMVTAPAALAVDSVVVRQPDCPGFPNGQITVFPSGGTQPYRYIWSTNPSDTTTLNPLSGLSAGDYVVTILDANDCTPFVQFVTIVDPPGIVITLDNLTGVSCPDDNVCDGTAAVSAQYSDGSTGTFNFMWSSGEITNGVDAANANQLCRGLQSVTVSDGTCGEILEIDVPSPENISAISDVVPVSCNGFMDGSITVTPSGGTGDFTFLWLGIGETTSTISDLAAGQYTVVLTDENDCSFTLGHEVDEPDELVLSLDTDNSDTAVSCSGDMDASVTVTYNFDDNVNNVGNNPLSWAANIAASSSFTATNLAAGTYSVTLTDEKNCQDSLTFTIGEPDPIEAVIPQPDPPLCFGDATTISIDTIFGGNGTNFLDYTFVVDNNGLNFPPDQTATVFAGIHTVTVEDMEGCSTEVELQIDQPSEIRVSFDPDIVVVELGDTTTRLNPIIQISTQVDSFIWTPIDYLSDPSIQNPFVIPAESLDYTLQVVDENGCTGIGSVFVELDANRNVYIPNVFSPNGDGFNDDFSVFACLGVQSINFARIYDRWGELVFEDLTPAPECEGIGTKLWDGTFNGSTLNPGVFVYIIEITFLDGVTLLYRGDVTLLR